MRVYTAQLVLQSHTCIERLRNETKILVIGRRLYRRFNDFCGFDRPDTDVHCR